MRIFIFLLVLALVGAGGYGYYLNPTACQKLGNDVVADTKAIYLPAVSATNAAPAVPVAAAVPVVSPAPIVPAVPPAPIAPTNTVQYPVGFVAAPNNPPPAPAATVTTATPLATAAPSATGQLPEFENADYDNALAAAKEHNVPLLILFTGSDWCPYCQKLEQEVLGEDQFRKYVSSHYVFLTVDDLRNSTVLDDDRTRIHDLETKFGVNGFPTLMIVDSNGTKIGEHAGYDPGSGPGSVINDLNNIGQK